MDQDWLDGLLNEAIVARETAKLRRARTALRVIDPTHVEMDGRAYVNFASNNYLGLTHHPRVLDAMRQALDRFGAGAGASGLVSGYTEAHVNAEAALAAWKGSQAAVLLPSGYQAAHAVVQTFAGVGESRGGWGVRFLIDKLAHASLIDAVTGSGKPYRVFPHNGLGKLERLLNEAPSGQLQVVITESIFSMDGDAADLAGFVELKKRHKFALVLDEAHGSGVYGPAGAGLAMEAGVSAHVDVSIATLSKALGVVGGAVCGSRAFCEAVVNWGRAYIYSTNVPPLVAAGAQAAIEVMRDEPWRQERVRALAKHVREALRATGVNVGDGDSPIVPVILATEEAALRAAGTLRDRGMLVVAIRPPTVPRATSRLRLTLSCEHRDEEVGALIQAVGALR